MAEIKLIDIVKMLVQSGHQIEYVKRTDGSLRITKIDGVKYTGSKGNTVARSMAGVTLSARRTVQLRRIGKIKRGKPKIKIGKPLEKDLKKTQKLWREKNTRGEGTVTISNVRYNLEHYGEDEARRKLEESNRYAKGLAYTENVKALISYINETILTKDIPDKDKELITEVMLLIAKNISTFKEEWIFPFYDLFYDYNKGERAANSILAEVRKVLN